MSGAPALAVPPALEALILVLSPAMVGLMVAVHAWAAPQVCNGWKEDVMASVQSYDAAASEVRRPGKEQSGTTSDMTGGPAKSSLERHRT